MSYRKTLEAQRRAARKAFGFPVLKFRSYQQQAWWLRLFSKFQIRMFKGAA